MDESLIKWLHSPSSAQPFQETCTFPSTQIFKHPPVHLQALGCQFVTREAQLVPRSGSLKSHYGGARFPVPTDMEIQWSAPLLSPSLPLLCSLPLFFEHCAISVCGFPRVKQLQSKMGVEAVTTDKRSKAEQKPRLIARDRRWCILRVFIKIVFFCKMYHIFFCEANKNIQVNFF